MRLTADCGAVSFQKRQDCRFPVCVAFSNVDWTLCANGVPSDLKLGWEDGGIVVLPKGLVVIVK